MQPQQRLRHSRDFARLRQQGQLLQHRLLKISYAPSQLSHHRYGFIVSKRLGNAVRRNKLHRRLREIMRHLDASIKMDEVSGLCGGYDIVIIARYPASKADYAELQHVIESLLGRAKLLKEQ